jgi:hypothetical protein
MKVKNRLSDTEPCICRPIGRSRKVRYCLSLFGWSFSDEEVFLFEGANCLGTELHLHFFAINKDGLVLKIGLPDLFGVALRKTDIAAVLLAFTV